MRGGIILKLTKNTENHLANRPVGMPSKEDFSFINCSIPTLDEHEMLARTLVLSVIYARQNGQC